MRTSNKKLKESLLRVAQSEEAALEEEMKGCEPHIFSEEFEKKMEKVMEIRARKVKRYYMMRYAAAMIVTVLLVGGILFVGNEEARASKVGIDILEWMENFFMVGEGETTRKEEEVLFDESQIGYLPEGFENSVGEYIVLDVRRNKIESMVDNEEIGQDVSLNAAGLEYRYIYKEDSKENVVTWKDKEDIYYYLQGTYDKEEIIKIMSSISY